MRSTVSDSHSWHPIRSESIREKKMIRLYVELSELIGFRFWRNKENLGVSIKLLTHLHNWNVHEKNFHESYILGWKVEANEGGHLIFACNDLMRFEELWYNEKLLLIRNIPQSIFIGVFKHTFTTETSLQSEITVDIWSKKTAQSDKIGGNNSNEMWCEGIKCGIFTFFFRKNVSLLK